MTLFVTGCRVDDVEDNSQLRRGAPVAHKIYGVPQTINSANYVYFLAFQELFRLKDLLKEDKEAPASKQPDLLDRMVTGPFPLTVELGSPATDWDAHFVIDTEELLNLHRGQGLDIFWRDTLTCPTEDEYIDMVNGSEIILNFLIISLFNNLFS